MGWTNLNLTMLGCVPPRWHWDYCSDLRTADGSSGCLAGAKAEDKLGDNQVKRIVGRLNSACTANEYQAPITTLMKSHAPQWPIYGTTGYWLRVFVITWGFDTDGYAQSRYFVFARHVEELLMKQVSLRCSLLGRNRAAEGGEGDG